MDSEDGPIELKRLSPEALDAARDRARHYRLLNQPHLAESIFRDVLEVDPDDEDAQIGLILTLCDAFGTGGGTAASEVLRMASELDDDYARSYYQGLVCERKAQAQLLKGGPGAGALAYDWLRQAMDHYEDAEPARPPGNDDVLLRWNTCARTLNTRPDVRPILEDASVHLLE